MGEWSPFTLSEFEWEVLKLYIKYGYGDVKLYNTSFFTSSLTDDTVCMALNEFAEKAVDFEGVLWKQEDEQALKQDLRKCQINSLIAHNEEKNVFDVINEQPTAYDVERVVADLQALKTKFEKIQAVCEDKFEANELHIRCLQIDKDIEIVKAGGVE